MSPTPTPSASQVTDSAGLYAHLDRWARLKPNAEAVVAPGLRLTWTMLRQAVDASAAAMIATGVERGDRVAMLAQPGAEFLVGFLATAAVGGVWIGLNPRYADSELDAVIGRVNPRLVLATPQIEGRSYRDWSARSPASATSVVLGDATPGAPCLGRADFLARGAGVPPETRNARYASVRASDPCLIVFTSGSTGAPKGALISQAALTGASQVQLGVWPADPLRVLVNLPINHIGCVGDLTCYALVGGGTLVFSPRFDAAGAADLINAEKITVWGQVPTMFQLVLDAPEFDSARLRSLQRIFWGGAHASRELIVRLKALCLHVATSYGQTETVGSVTFTPEGASLADLAQTVGRAVAPYEVRIVAAGGEADDGGEVEVRTPFGMLGYWNDPGASAAAVSEDGWRRTGDVGVLTPQGDLKLLGRVHDVFKSGGYNIHPPEIEAALESHPRVRQAAVVGAPDPLYGSAVVAFIVADGPAPSPADLRAHLAPRLANYKSPKRYLFLEDLPRLPVGKVDKQALLKRASRA